MYHSTLDNKLNNNNKLQIVLPQKRPPVILASPKKASCHFGLLQKGLLYKKGSLMTPTKKNLASN